MGNPTKPSPLEIAEIIAAGAGDFLELARVWAGWGERDDDDESTTMSITELEEMTECLGFSIEVVESEGGFEGGGDTVVRVFKFTGPVMCEKKEIFIRVTGWYSSYEGVNWDEGGNPEYVFPREVVVTQYFTDAELKE